MAVSRHVFVLATVLLLTTAQQAIPSIAADPGSQGSDLEVAHLYYEEVPTGIAVTSNGRMFSNYPSGLDLNNSAYQVAELTSFASETAYPSVELNNPPAGRINYSTTPATSSNDASHLIGVQSVAIDPYDRLWILDTGRAMDNTGALAPASPGGPKLVVVDTNTNRTVDTINFPPNIAYPQSYLNDLRLDFRPNLQGTTGKGVAYITDSSQVGRNGIVVVDLGSKQAWRHLDNTRVVRATDQFVGFIWGEPATYSSPSPGSPTAYSATGSDGIALVDNGDTLYFTTNAGRNLYSIPTAFLRDRSMNSELRAQAAVQSRGQHGWSDGLQQDTNNLVYSGGLDTNSVNYYDPASAQLVPYIRDPRIGWPDSLWVQTLARSNASYLWFTSNQLWRSPSRRQKPLVLFRAPTVNGGRILSPQ